MRSLILGAGGQIGAHLVAAADRRGHMVEGTWYRRPLANFVPLDLCDGEAVREVIAEFEPDAVYIAAGMSQIDFAESHAAECQALAVAGTKNVARAAREIGACVVLFTSEQVFGECPHPVTEMDSLAPLSVYGKAQQAAENALRSILPVQHLIVRSSCIYGPHDLPRNAALHAVHRLRDGHSLTAPKDRYVQPTFAKDLAEACFTLVENRETGTIHIVGSERLTEAAFLKQIAFIHGFDCDLICPVPAAALCEEAPRPNSPWLDRARMRSLLGSRAIRPLGDGLRAMRDEMLAPVPLRRAA